MITIQDGKGHILEYESLVASLKQISCNHNWIRAGSSFDDKTYKTVYECPKCLSVKTE